MFYKSYQRLIKYEGLVERCQDGIAYTVEELIERVKFQKLPKYQDVLVFGDP